MVVSVIYVCLVRCQDYFQLQSPLYPLAWTKFTYKYLSKLLFLKLILELNSVKGCRKRGPAAGVYGVPCAQEVIFLALAHNIA